MNKLLLPLALLLVGVLIFTQETPTNAQTRTQPKQFATLAELEAWREPTSANPYLAYLPSGVEPDYDYWEQWSHLVGKERAQTRSAPARTINYAEMEASNASGQNDDLVSAENIANFGLGAGEDPAADITGVVFDAAVASNTASPFAEDDGNINVANSLPVLDGSLTIVDGTIGDGPFGSAGSGSGDFDFFELTGLEVGELVEIAVQTASPLGDLDPNIAVWGANGRIFAFSEDISGINFDVGLRYIVPASGTLYLSIQGFRNVVPIERLPANPFISGSGLGVGSEGAYRLVIGKNIGDLDHYSFDLDAGDIIGANVLAASSMGVRLIDANGNPLITSLSDGSGNYGDGAPLPGGGTSSYAFVAETAGTYTAQVMGTPNVNYTLQLRAFRPSLESDAPGSKQILFLDFDGATINAAALFGGGNTNATLSPLSSFLGNWGLAAGDESAVIDAILATVVEGLDTDIATNGNNARFDIEILNSRDHADPFGQPNVSRMIIGGTIAELGIQTIGIADSIDVGNFAHEETAVVLLDILSAAAGTNSNSLNSFARAPGTGITDIIGVGVGNIINHEAGHYFGNWHTDQFNDVANLMDQGGNLPLSIIGIGADNIFGSADDIDPDHVTDTYNPNEFYGGNENTLNEISYALSTPNGVTTAVTVQAQTGIASNNLWLVAIVSIFALAVTLRAWFRPKSS